MKNMIILLTLVLSLSPMVQEQTITATYNGFEDDTYYFSGEDGNPYEFQDVDDSVWDSFDLLDASTVDRLYKVSYTIDEELDDETGDTYESYRITKLVLIN